VNYRHAFHAGNFADVHKHVILLALLERLKRKASAFFYLDTHAGRGSYDLKSEEARRSAEWREGVGLIRSASPNSPDLQRYLSVLTELGGNSQYPGSPLLAAAALRPGDRAVLVEQQFDEVRVLQRELRGRRGITVNEGDGYAALTAYLPPKENRGLVLLDPPYESDREFSTLRQALESGLTRWPNGLFTLWYPLKANRDVPRFHSAVKESGRRKLLLLELSVRPSDSPSGLNGSGVLIANPPWQFDTEMRTVHEELHTLLAPDGSGGVRVEWLVPE
jgi:23S rRNA (adenine2030-N6)-methyltransferase